MEARGAQLKRGRKRMPASHPLTAASRLPKPLDISRWLWNHMDKKL